MTYAIQQFHATRYVTVATANTLRAAFRVAGETKRKAPELPVRICMGDTKITTNERKTA